MYENLFDLISNISNRNCIKTLLKKKIFLIIYLIIIFVTTYVVAYLNLHLYDKDILLKQL
jgi:hypothetical protein